MKVRFDWKTALYNVIGAILVIGGIKLASGGDTIVSIGLILIVGGTVIWAQKGGSSIKKRKE